MSHLDRDKLIVCEPSLSNFNQTGLSAEEKGQVRQTVSVVADLRSRFNQLIPILDANTVGLQAKMDEISQKIESLSTLHPEVVLLKGDFAAVKTAIKLLGHLQTFDPESVKSEVALLKDDVASVKMDVATVKNSVENLSNMPDRVSGMADQLKRLQDSFAELDTLKKDVAGIKVDLSALPTSLDAKLDTKFDALMKMLADQKKEIAKSEPLLQPTAVPQSVQSSVHFPGVPDALNTSVIVHTQPPTCSNLPLSYAVSLAACRAPTGPVIGANVYTATSQSVLTTTASSQSIYMSSTSTAGQFTATQSPSPFIPPFLGGYPNLVGHGVSQQPQPSMMMNPRGQSTPSVQSPQRSINFVGSLHRTDVVNPARTSPFFHKDSFTDSEKSLTIATFDPAVAGAPSKHTMKVMQVPPPFSEPDSKSLDCRTCFEWLATFENWLALQRVPLNECSSVLYNSLRGRALGFARTKDPAILANYYSFCNALLDYFDKHSDQRAKRKLIENIFMEQKENFETFVWRIYQAAYDLHGHSESNKLLVDEIVRSAVCLRSIRTVQQFIANTEAELGRVLPIDEMITCVRGFEAFQQTKCDISSSSTEGVRYNPPHTGVRSSGGISGTARSIKNQTCDNCGRTNHSTQSCYNNLPPKQRAAKYKAHWEAQQDRRLPGRDGQARNVEENLESELDGMLGYMKVNAVGCGSALKNTPGVFSDSANNRFVSNYPVINISALKREKPNHPLTRLILRTTPHLYATVQGHRVQAFMDVGANASLISEKWFRKIVDTASPQWIAANVANVKVNCTGYSSNDRIDITEFVALDLTMGSQTKRSIFLVDKNSQADKLLVGWSTIAQFFGNIFTADIDFVAGVEDLPRMPPTQVQPSDPASVEAKLAKGTQHVAETSKKDRLGDLGATKVHCLMVHPCEAASSVNTQRNGPHFNSTYSRYKPDCSNEKLEPVRITKTYRFGQERFDTEAYAVVGLDNSAGTTLSAKQHRVDTTVGLRSLKGNYNTLDKAQCGSVLWDEPVFKGGGELTQIMEQMYSRYMDLCCT